MKTTVTVQGAQQGFCFPDTGRPGLKCNAISAFSAPRTTALRKLMTQPQENRLRDLLNAAGVLAEALRQAPETATVSLDEALDSGTVLVDEHGADVVLQGHDVTVHVRKQPQRHPA